MDKKPMYKIKEVNSFWRFHVYKKVWGGWKKIGGADDMEYAEAKIRDSAPTVGGILYDAEGVRI